MKTETQHNPSREEIETSKLVTEMINLMADTRKMQTETRWHPLAIVASAFAAGAVFLGAVVATVKALFF